MTGPSPELENCLAPFHLETTRYFLADQTAARDGRCAILQHPEVGAAFAMHMM
jgi:hypothetical protein